MKTFRFGTHSNHPDSLPLATFAMLVAHLAFLATAIALPISPAPKPKPAEMPSPLSVTVEQHPGDEEQEELTADSPIVALESADDEPKPEDLDAFPERPQPYEWEAPVEAWPTDTHEPMAEAPGLSPIVPAVPDPARPRPRRAGRTNTQALTMLGGPMEVAHLFEQPTGFEATLSNKGLYGVVGGTISGPGGGTRVGGLAFTDKARHGATTETYRRRIMRILGRNLPYPDGARDRQLEGTVGLELTVLADGTIAKVRVRRSSGHAVLDGAARRHVQRIGKLPELPPRLGQSKRFRITLSFRIA